MQGWSKAVPASFIKAQPAVRAAYSVGKDPGTGKWIFSVSSGIAGKLGWDRFDNCDVFFGEGENEGLALIMPDAEGMFKISRHKATIVIRVPITENAGMNEIAQVVCEYDEEPIHEDLPDDGSVKPCKGVKITLPKPTEIDVPKIELKPMARPAQKNGSATELPSLKGEAGAISKIMHKKLDDVILYADLAEMMSSVSVTRGQAMIDQVNKRMTVIADTLSPHGFTVTEIEGAGWMMENPDG